MDDDTDQINAFVEKAKEDGGWINGGFMVMEPEIFNYLDGDDCVLEQLPMRAMSAEGKVCAYKHVGFWQCMDTQRDKGMLTRLWEEDRAPWKVWRY